MVAYTFRINEINVFYYQEKLMRELDSKSGLEGDACAKNSKFVNYIMDHYATISIRVGLFIVADALKIT